MKLDDAVLEEQLKEAIKLAQQVAN